MSGATFASARELADALRRAERAHGEHERQLGHADADWPAWYADFMVREQSRGEQTLVALRAYPTRAAAELAQTALTAAGIDSVVAADDAGGAYPFSLDGGVRLLVDAADATDAEQVLS